jgi:acylphosphatase
VAGSQKAAAEIYVSGRVQGVGYRFYTERVAHEFNLSGWSMNLPDGRVMLEIEGDKTEAERFVEELKKGPSMARVTDVSVAWKPYQGKYKNFSIKV